MGENAAVIDNALHEASKRGNIPFCKELVLAGLSPNLLDQAGNSPVHWACRGGHWECLKILLQVIAINKANAVLNVQNKMGDSPLHLACWGGHPECVKLLLESGADPLLKNKAGDTARDLCKDDESASLIIKSLSSESGHLAGSSEEDN